jgi:hypothetical protein
VSCLNVVLTHRPAAEVREQLEVYRTLAPTARVVACYTGPQSELALLEPEDAVGVDDDSLAGPARTHQSYHRVFEALHRHWIRDDPSIDALYLFEYDHLILDGGFEDALRELADRTGAGFLGKHCGVRNGTNWAHYTRFRRDERLLAHLRSLSVRDDPQRLYGTLGTGMWMSRAALESYVALRFHPPCYGELYVPTLLHHLGHRVVDIDAASDLYRAVRWEPEAGIEEIEELTRSGAFFVHPVKDLAVRRAAQAAVVQRARKPNSPRDPNRSPRDPNRCRVVVFCSRSLTPYGETRSPVRARLSGRSSLLS